MSTPVLFFIGAGMRRGSMSRSSMMVGGGWKWFPSSVLLGRCWGLRILRRSAKRRYGGRAPRDGQEAGRCIPKLLATLDGRTNVADGLRVGPRSGRRCAPTRWRSGAVAGHPRTLRKSETVILVIYGCFWLILSTKFVVTDCRKTICVSFLACMPGGPGFRGRRCEKFANNFGMHGGRQGYRQSRNVSKRYAGWGSSLQARHRGENAGRQTRRAGGTRQWPDVGRSRPHPDFVGRLARGGGGAVIGGCQARWPVLGCLSSLSNAP